MRRFLLARLGGMAVVLALVAVLVFILTRAAPGDPVAVLLGDQATAEDIARVQKLYGLDRSLPEQFVLWLRELSRGNLGDSIFLQRPVTQALRERAEPTALLSLMAVAIATLIGVPCGIVSAVYRGRAVDQAFTGFAMLGASVPSFWFGLVLTADLRGLARLVSGVGLWRARCVAGAALALPGAAGHGVGRAQLGADHPFHPRIDARRARRRLRAHRARQGPARARVVLKHALRNALVPIVTVIGLTVALMIGGAVVTETVFGLPGVGNPVVSRGATIRRARCWWWRRSSW